MRQNRNRVRLQKRRKMFLMQQKRKRRRRRQQIFMRGTAAAMLLFAFCISIRFIHMAKRQTDCRRINAGACDNRGKYDRDKYDREFRNR